MTVRELYSVLDKSTEHFSFSVYDMTGNLSLGYTNSAYPAENIPEEVWDSDIEKAKVGYNSVYINIDHPIIRSLTEEELKILSWNDRSVKVIFPSQVEKLFDSVLNPENEGNYIFPWKETGNHTKCPDKFIVKEDIGFSAIDNSTGDAWCETFETLGDAVKYLLDEYCVTINGEEFNEQKKGGKLWYEV